MDLEDLTSILVDIKSTGKDPVQEIDRRIESCQLLIQQLKDVRNLLCRSGKHLPMSQTGQPHGQEKGLVFQRKLKIARYLMKHETIAKETAMTLANTSGFTAHTDLNSDWFFKVRQGVYSLSEKGKKMVEENPLLTQLQQSTES